MADKQPMLYRISAAMKQLGISRSTLYRLVRAGDLKLVKVSERASCITSDSMMALIEKGEVHGR